MPVRRLQLSKFNQVEDREKFQFEFMGSEYLVDDQYCIDPACRCNEAVLTYVDLSEEVASRQSRFVLRVSLSTGKYTVESNGGYNTDDIRQIHGAYIKHIHNDLGLLRRRYTKMKDYG